MCILCGKPVNGPGIVESIDGREYVFDRKECAVLFMKLKRAYGDDFCVYPETC
jgi:hypothetical protein